MTGIPVRVSPDWLRLRSPADAAARSAELAAVLRPPPRHGGVRVVHDLGCGDGSMGRWLAPRLDGPQHWVLHDIDAGLLRLAAANPPVPDRPDVTIETRCGDVTRLGPDDLAGASLVAASALLDVLTGEELDTVVRFCAATGAPALVTLSVTGGVTFSPTDPLDNPLRQAFNDHQRRATTRGHLLGPDAARVAVGLFHDLGYRVRVRPSPWHLHTERALVQEWLTDWVAAAVEQQPALGDRSQRYLADRLERLAAGGLRVAVHHLDLLAAPGGAAP